MANNTNLLINCEFGESSIRFIQEKTGLEFERLPKGANNCSIDSYIFCERCIGTENLKFFIQTFQSTTFAHPETAVLVISDDSYSDFDGVYRPIN